MAWRGKAGLFLSRFLSPIDNGIDSNWPEQSTNILPQEAAMKVLHSIRIFVMRIENDQAEAF